MASTTTKIKNVVRIYASCQDTRFRFFGNVELGRDLQMEDLRARCAIILATGESDRRLESRRDLAGVHSATEFVGWYNLRTSNRVASTFDARRVVIIGNGTSPLMSRGL